MIQRIEIKNRWTGEVIFSHECEDNSIAKTVMAAVQNSANLSGSDLSGSDLRYSDLNGSKLSGSDLRYSDLRGSDLRGSDLSGSDLSDSDLRYSDLSGSDLRGIRYNESTVFFALQCPEEGEFIAWKKVKGCLVKLLIPADAQRSSATSRKCRASKAHVLAIYDEDGNEKESVVSDNYVTTTYKVGEDVLPDSWGDNRWNECSHGIHFFITRREAELYN